MYRTDFFFNDIWNISLYDIFVLLYTIFVLFLLCLSLYHIGYYLRRKLTNYYATRKFQKICKRTEVMQF